MRTVDPDRWYKRMRKPPNHVTSQNSEDMEMRIRSSFGDALKEYWRNCSVGGVQRISDRSLTKCERWCRGILVVFALWAGVSVLSYTLQQLRAAPALQVNLRWVQHSIQRVPFPAVALCSNNVISERSLISYARFLDSRDQNNTYQLRSIRKLLLTFGALVTLDNVDNADVMFMQFLAHADPRFNVTRLMLQLSPSCSSILARCSWRGWTTPCEHLFAARITPLGFCCVFNSRYSSEDFQRTPKFLGMVGRDYGLAAIVKENTDDFAFIRRASVGLEVLLFDGSDYPILEGSGVRVYPVARNASVFMSVSTSAQYVADREPVRGCHRRSPEGARSSRSYAWCLTQCRRRALATLCGCRLHTFVPDPTDNNPTCSLLHLSCLNKHREKLIYYFPIGYTDAALNEEVENGLYCDECAPDCTRLAYSARITTGPYSDTTDQKVFKNVFSKGISLVNSSVIRVYYSSEHQILYGIENNLRWFESFATISSTWCTIVGATLVAGSELTYHCTVRWMHHYRRRIRMAHPS